LECLTALGALGALGALALLALLALLGADCWVRRDGRVGRDSRKRGRSAGGLGTGVSRLRRGHGRSIGSLLGALALLGALGRLGALLTLVALVTLGRGRLGRLGRLVGLQKSDSSGRLFLRNNKQIKSKRERRGAIQSTVKLETTQSNSTIQFAER